MAAKPEIQYVGQFYVYGSEAKKLAPKQQPKKNHFQTPAVRPDNTVRIYVDPVALAGILVAVFMLVALVFSAVQIKPTWQEYNEVKDYMVELKRENAELEHKYRTGFDLEEIRAKALAIGMIPATEAQTIIVKVTIPEPEVEPTVWEDMVWFVKGLFA